MLEKPARWSQFRYGGPAGWAPFGHLVWQSVGASLHGFDLDGFNLDDFDRPGFDGPGSGGPGGGRGARTRSAARSVSWARALADLSRSRAEQHRRLVHHPQL